MRIFFTRRFLKERKKAAPKIKQAFKKRLSIFENDAFHPLLGNHLLTGEYFGYRSINITGDWRAVYKETEDGIYFVALGTHSQLYQ